MVLTGIAGNSGSFATTAGAAAAGFVRLGVGVGSGSASAAACGSGSRAPPLAKAAASIGAELGELSAHTGVADGASDAMGRLGAERGAVSARDAATKLNAI